MKKINYKFLQAEWEKRFPCEHLQAVFYFDFYRDGANTTDLLKRNKDIQRFGKKFSSFCKSFDFDPSQMSAQGKFLIDTGKLPSGFAETLCNVYEEIKGIQDQAESDLLNWRSGGKNRHYGPTKVPGVFAKHILIGLEIHRSSPKGLKLLRKFIEPNGGLQKRLLRLEMEKEKIDLVVYRQGGDNIKEWATQKRQTCERMMLSYQLKCEVKSFANCRKELHKLRGDIKRYANEYYPD